MPIVRMRSAVTSLPARRSAAVTIQAVFQVLPKRRMPMRHVRAAVTIYIATMRPKPLQTAATRVMRTLRVPIRKSKAPVGAVWPRVVPPLLTRRAIAARTR